MSTPKTRLPNVAVALQQFTTHPEINTLVLKGQWGSGKSHFVRDYFAGAAPREFKFLSNASLFGLKSSEDVLRQVHNNSVSPGEVKKGGKVMKLRRYLQAFEHLPQFFRGSKLFDAIRQIETRDMLIVFDDIERKHDSLSLKEVFGLISNFSENLDCKVLVILNEAKLEGPDKAVLDAQREKVFDREVLFDPTTAENALIGFKSQKYLEYATRVFEVCETKSIRVMRLTDYLCTEVQTLLPTSDEAFLKDVTHQAIKLSVLHLACAGKVDLTKLPDSNFHFAIGEDESKKTPGSEILKALEFETLPYDKLLLDLILNKRPNPEEWSKLLADQTELRQQAVIRGEIREAYALFQRNFRTTKEAACARLFAVIDQNHLRLSVDDLDTAKGFLLDFGYDKAIPDWVENVVLRHAKNFDFEVCNQMKAAKLSAKAQQAVDDRLSELLAASPEQILLTMARSHGWGDWELVALRRISEEQFYQWMVTSESLELFSAIRFALATFDPTVEPPQKDTEIGKRIAGALIKVIAIDGFRKRQVYSYFLGPERRAKLGLAD